SGAGRHQRERGRGYEPGGTHSEMLLPFQVHSRAAFRIPRAAQNADNRVVALMACRLEERVTIVETRAVAKVDCAELWLPVPVSIAMRLHPYLRRLAKLPGFSAVAVLTLAIGIGANTAIFSVVEGVLLKPLPYPQSQLLLTLDHTAPGVSLPHVGAAPFLYFTYREDGRAFQDVGLWTSGSVSVTGLAQPEEVRQLTVTDGVLPILGVQPMAGRLFTKADDTANAPLTAILTAGYWRTKFGGDPSAVGRTITLNGRPREIIGVLPDSFRLLDVKAQL